MPDRPRLLLSASTKNNNNNHYYCLNSKKLGKGGGSIKRGGAAEEKNVEGKQVSDLYFDGKPSSAGDPTPILELKGVMKEYSASRGGKTVPILQNVNLSINENEFVSIVGPSGSGKSTLLRIIMGLEAPTAGRVFFKGEESPPGKVNPFMAMVFQSFGLFPWLTVLENVEFGLESLHVSKEARREKSVRIIQEVGLDGFEDAYPRELSGGMKQRVGIARALVTDPEILLMDEPFSALDPLTAESLREEILRVWNNKFTSPEVIIMVTHNIEEAVYLSDKVLIMSRRPGTISHKLRIDMPRPREKRDKLLYEYVDKITTMIT
jgi:NitT/TauT family transport system ATP-binding protein